MRSNLGWLMLMVVVGSCGTATATAEEPPPRPPWVFVAGPSFGMESGVRTTTGLGRMLFSGDDFISEHLAIDERHAWGKVLGVTGRLAKLFFVDGPLVGGQHLLRHEVFGHGSRAREAGLDPSYEFRLVPPYSWILSSDDASFGGTLNGLTGFVERDIGTIVAGIEADHFSAWWLTQDMVENRGWISYHDQLEYVLAKLTDRGRISFVSHASDGNADPDRYVDLLQSRFNLWRPEDRLGIAESLRRAYIYNFIDPTFWQAIYHLTITYLYEGKRDAKLTMIPLTEDLDVYPATRFNLSPFGAEHYLDLFVGYRELTFDLYGRVGSSGLASYGGGGVRVRGVRPGLGLAFGGELDVWTQPEMLLEQRFVFERQNRAGFSAGLHVDWHVYGPVMATGKIAAKTSGYLMGQPLDAGPYGYLGVSIAPGAKGAVFEP